MDYQFNAYIVKWKSGQTTGNRGVRTQILSKHIHRYLREKYCEKCCLCGWHKKNPVTNRVPLEVDHIDGNADNNTEVNLRLICPNCHSLTASFRNLNKGHGRSWRLQYLNKASKSPD